MSKRTPHTHPVGRALIGAVGGLLASLVIKVVMGLRVSEEEEYSGVDLAVC